MICHGGFVVLLMNAMREILEGGGYRQISEFRLYPKLFQMLDDDDPNKNKPFYTEMCRMRRLAFYAVIVLITSLKEVCQVASSAVSTSVLILLIPLMYAHIQRAQTQMQDKIDFCRFR